MFSPDVVSLRQFYSTPMGEAARALVARRLHTLWPPADGEALLGVGFVTPYLEPYLEPRAPVVVAMPAAQGAAYWPAGGGNRVFLAHESELPIAENSINRLLMMHSVEHSEELSGLMREAWRVLTPGGRALVVVPNRLSFWSRSPRSPFGYGRPFSMAQLRALLAEHQFTLLRSGAALFTPPLYWRWLWRISPKTEAFFRFIRWPFGGVLMLEAEKQLYAAVKQPALERKSYRAPAIAARPALSRQ